jgi:hypothetical protein
MGQNSNHYSTYPGLPRLEFEISPCNGKVRYGLKTPWRHDSASAQVKCRQPGGRYSRLALRDPNIPNKLGVSSVLLTKARLST